MVSLKNVLSTALFAALALAQAPTTNFSSADINSLINPAQGQQPTAGTKLAWCGAQKTLCGSLCGGSFDANTCDQTMLTSNCTCSSNHSAPAQQFYATSLISQECSILLGNCLGAHASDLASQDNCKKMYICGNATTAQASAAGNANSASSTSASGTASGAAATGSAASGSSGSGATSVSSHAGGVVSYGEFAPPMFVMMMVGAFASFM